MRFRFGSREICNVVFKARTEMQVGNTTFQKGQPVLYMDTAKTSTVEGATSTVYAQGGRGNPRLIAWEGERTVTFTVEDALLSDISLAMLTGAGLMNMKDASAEAPLYVNHTFDLPILKGGIVKIDYDTVAIDGAEDIFVSEDAPIFGTILDMAGYGVIPCTLVSDGIKLTAGKDAEGKDIVVDPTYIDPENIDAGCVYHIADQQTLVLDFGEQAADFAGQTIRVDCYLQKKQGASQISIDAEHFAGNFYVEAETLFREQGLAKDFPAILTFPNVKLQSNFTLNMSNSGDPATYSFVMDAMPAYTKFDKQHKVFVAIDIIGEETLKPAKVSEDKKAPAIDPAFTQVEAGANGWTPDQFDGDAKNVKFSKLGSYLKATVNGTDIEFTGTLNRVDNWTAFSSNPADLSCYYFPMKLYADGAELQRTTAAGGSVKHTVTTDGLEYIFAVRPDSPIAVTKLVKGGKTTNYTFDFSRVVFK